MTPPFPADFTVAKAIVDQFDSAAVLADKHGIIQHANSAGQQLSTGCLIGQRLADMLDDGEGLGTLLTAQNSPALKTTLRIGTGQPGLPVVIKPLMIEGACLGALCHEGAPKPDRPRSYPKLREHGAELRLQYLMEHLEEGVWDYDTRTNIFTVSNHWRQIRGIGGTEAINLPQNEWLLSIHPDDRSVLRQSFEDLRTGRADTMRLQYRHKHREGHFVWVQCNAKVMETDSAGQPTRIVGTDTDVTDLRRRERDRAQLENKLQLAIDAAGIGVWEFNAETEMVHWDDRMLEIYGLTDGQNDRSAMDWSTMLHPEDAPKMLEYSDHCQRYGLDFQHDYRVIRPGGEVRHVRSRASRVTVPGAKPKLIGVNIDITEDHLRAQALEQAKAQLHYEARHDALTGLANRRLLDETTAALFERITEDHTYAVLHLDLDYFKTVNDTLGHAAGDAVLVEVGRLISNLIGEAGLVCRIGGDEFAIFFSTAPAPDKLRETCGCLVTALKQPIIYNGHSCQIGISIGCALGHGPVADHAELFKQADTALYAAKEAGKNCYRFYPAPGLIEARLG